MCEKHVLAWQWHARLRIGLLSSVFNRGRQTRPIAHKVQTGNPVATVHSTVAVEVIGV